MNVILFKWLTTGLLFFCLISTSQALEIFTEDLKLESYELISERRIDKTIFEYKYKIRITNTSNTLLKNVRILFAGPLVLFKDGDDDIKYNTKGIIEARDLGGLPFGNFEVGETKTSQTVLTIVHDRTLGPAKIDIITDPVYVYSKKITYNDSKNNKIDIYVNSESSLPSLSILALFATIPPKLSDLTIKEHQNPTNVTNLNDLPFITDQFVEITIPDRYAHPDLNFHVYFEVKYTKNPYRLLVFEDNEIYWASFVNDTSTNTAKFDIALKGQNKITFALIETY